MRRRTPLVVSVVGALLIGGATTGSTYARWLDQAAAPAASVTSGTMTHAVGPAGGLSLVSGGVSRTTTASVTDTSPAGARNLRQEVRVATVQLLNPTDGLSLAHLRLAVVRRGSTSCPTATLVPASGYTSAVLDRTTPGGAYTMCVHVGTAAGAPSATGTLRLGLVGRQVRPDGTSAGWTAASTVTVNLTVTPAAPTGLTCVSVQKGTSVTLSWTAASGVTYSLLEGGTVRLSGIAGSSLPVTATQTQMGGGNNIFITVRAVDAAGRFTDSGQVFDVNFNGGKCSVS